MTDASGAPIVGWGVVAMAPDAAEVDWELVDPPAAGTVRMSTELQIGQAISWSCMFGGSGNSDDPANDVEVGTFTVVFGAAEQSITVVPDPWSDGCGHLAVFGGAP